ncbi:MAG TPA: DUF983 domain-containing protein [Acidimicrobiia bacterium]|nr:DUF983 domain-containing protein [Acidimicrobiia bacterium]
MSNRTLEPSRALALWRGVRGKCPRCGGGKLFHHWFHMAPDCPHCGLHFEREPGYWVGAVAINTTVVGFLFAVLLVAFSAATVPDIPWVKLLIAEVPLMGLGPIIFYPFSKTLWVAIDRAFLAHL